MRPALGLLVAALLVASGPATTQTPGPIEQSVGDLLSGGIGKSVCLFGKRQTLGVLPFEDDKIPIGVQAGKRIYDEIVSRLVAARPSCTDVLDGSSIGAVMTYLSRSGALQRKDGNVIAALEDATQTVDIVVFPQLYGQGNEVVLTLRAVERRSGRTLVMTPPRPLPAAAVVSDLADVAISMDAALSKAAHYFAMAVPDLVEVRPTGFFYEATGARPQAGQYMLEKLLTALGGEIANPLSGKTLKVLGDQRPPGEPPRSSEGGSAATQTYELTGRYWLRGNAVDVKLTMTRSDGATYAYAARIRLEDFSGLTLRPTNPAVTGQGGALGAIGMRLTSPRGPTPVYRVGEELTLNLRVDRPAWLYCFYVDATGAVMTVLPNPYRSGASANHVRAGEGLTLPDPAADPFRFVFTGEPLGEEVFRCFATSRDVRADLPPAFFPADVAVIDKLSPDGLGLAFARLVDLEISEASVTVTVTP